jgi:hypothetical protein
MSKIGAPGSRNWWRDHRQSSSRGDAALDSDANTGMVEAPRWYVAHEPNYDIVEQVWGYDVVRRATFDRSRMLVHGTYQTIGDAQTMCDVLNMRDFGDL